MSNSYLHRRFVVNVDRNNVNTIIECGSRDCLDAIALYKHYQPKVIYAFECNPEAIKLCEVNIRSHPYINFVPKAVYDINGMIDFYATDMNRSVDKNLGASSILWHRDNKEEFFQKKIQVEAIRLDTFFAQEGISKVDLLCMDLQGVELKALEGMGSYLYNTRYIITEVSFEHYYEGDVLFDDVEKYLNDRGFRTKAGSGFLRNRKTGITNCLFENKTL